MASDKSMYWLAAGVLALGIGSRYGHGDTPNEWVACAIHHTTEILDRATDRVGSQAERTVAVLSDHQNSANDRAEAALARAQARAAQLMARREAATSRMHAALARIDSGVTRVQIDDDSE
jgi:hypothetical protein